MLCVFQCGSLPVTVSDSVCSLCQAISIPYRTFTLITPSLQQKLIDALVREDIRNIIIILGHATPEDINAPYGKDDGRTALHIAAALGNVVYVQLLLWVSPQQLASHSCLLTDDVC